MNRRSLSFALVLVSMMFLVIMPLNADDSLGWEGVSFGLVINKYQEALTTIHFVDLNDSLVNSVEISNERTINEPQFRMVVNTNVRTENVRITLTFEPFSMKLSGNSYKLPYTVRMHDVDGYTPMQFEKGTSIVDRIAIKRESSVTFASGVSPDGSTRSFEYSFSFEFDDALMTAPVGTYSCNLIAEVVST